MLMLLLAVKFGLLPTSGDNGPRSLLMPGLTLASYSLAAVTRLTRSSVIDVRA